LSHDNEQIYNMLRAEISALSNRIFEIQNDIAEMKERLARLETKVDAIESELRKRNGMMKWTIVLLGMILSFVAAMFGMGWRPP